MNAYEILLTFIGKTSDPSNSVNYNYASKRFSNILSFLNPFNLHIMVYPGFRANILYYKPIDLTKNTIMFMAHHDVVNPEYDNVNDNTASVANLIYLARELEDLKLAYNVVFAFTDGEELVDFDRAGSAHVAKDILKGTFGTVIEVINLELTAKGSYIWGTGNSNFLSHKDIYKVNTPFSDTAVLISKGVKSTCIGLVDLENLNSILKTGYCSTWGLCHDKNDTISKAKSEDMTGLVNTLKNYLLFGKA